jgi:hypothetical protein
MYGDIYSLKVMHLTIIVLNSPTAVKEIIDKRGATSSNRPASVISDIITPDNLNLGSGRYGKYFSTVSIKYLLSIASSKRDMEGPPQGLCSHVASRKYGQLQTVPAR